MKEFVYLYPIPEYTDFHVGTANKAKRAAYSQTLNEAIDLRYRQNGFGINYVLFQDHQMSELVTVQPSDRIIYADISYATLMGSNGQERRYADADFILDQLEGLKQLRLAGFHLWDCVEKVAKRAHERGIDTLVDEELTEVLALRTGDPDFKTATFPSFDPKKDGDAWYQLFRERRRDKPWMWQGQ